MSRIMDYSLSTGVIKQGYLVVSLECEELGVAGTGAKVLAGAEIQKMFTKHAKWVELLF